MDKQVLISCLLPTLEKEVEKEGRKAGRKEGGRSGRLGPPVGTAGTAGLGQEAGLWGTDRHVGAAGCVSKP